MKSLQFSAVLFLILNSLSIILLANPSEQTIPVVAFWEKGDFHYYEITKKTSTVKNGVIESKNAMSYLASFIVLDAHENGYTIKWRIECLNNENQSLTSSTDKNNILTDFVGTDIIYKTTSTGEITTFLNMEEVSEKLKNSFKNSTSNNLKKNIPLAEYIFKNHNQILPAFEEIELFHSLFGFQFKENKTIEFKDARINNKIKFELDGKFLPKNIHNGESVGIFTNVLTLNKANSITNHSVIEKIKSEGIELSELNFQEKEEITIDYNRGLVLSIYKETLTTISSNESVSTSLAIGKIQ